MKKTLFAALSLGAAAAALLSTPAQAQRIDYDQLEQFFEEPVTASATGKPQRASEVPVAMEILTQEQIRRSGARSLADALRLVPGLDVTRWGMANADVQVRNVRQAYSPRLLVLVDGRQVYSDHYGMTFWDMIPVELAAVRQIEVIKGPNSALYGFNAVGGVINIVTYDPTDTKVNRLDVLVGTQNLKQGSAVVTANKPGSYGLRLSAGGFRSDEFDRGFTADEAQNAWAPVRRALALDARAKLAEGWRLGLEATHNEGRTNDFIDTYFSNRQHGSSLKATLLGETSLGATEATLYRNSLVAGYDYRRYGMRWHFDQDVTVAKLSHLFKVGADHTLRLGGEWRRNEMDTVRTASAKVGYDVWSGSIMWDWALTDKLTLTNALRYDLLQLERSGYIDPASGRSNANWDRDVETTSFNSGLVWRATDDLALRVTAAQGVQMPSLYLLGNYSVMSMGAGQPNFIELGNPQLKPTRVTNVEIGADYDLREAKTKLRASIFQQWTRDLFNNFADPLTMTMPPATGAMTETYSNVGSSRATGLELSASGKFGQGWSWGASYVFAHIDDKLRSNGTATPYMNIEKGSPQHVVGGRLGYQTGDWTFDVDAKYISDVTTQRTQTYTMKGDGHVSVGGRIAWSPIKDVTVSLAGDSLLRANEQQLGALETERRVWLGLSVGF